MPGFLQVLASTHLAAGRNSYIGKLTCRGYPVPTLRTLLTARRILAYDAVRDYTQGLKGVNKAALREKPGLHAKLEF